MNPNDELMEHLQNLHRQNQPTTGFADELEVQLLTDIPDQMVKPKHSLRHMLFNRFSLSAAAFVLCLGIVASIPTLETIAQDILDYFSPPKEVNSADSIEPFIYSFLYKRYDSLVEADEKIEFDFLVLPDADDRELVNIYADHDATLLVYWYPNIEEVDYVKPYISLRQMIYPNGLPRKITIPGDIDDIEQVSIHGLDAVYAQAGWILQTPIYDNGQRGSLYQIMGENSQRIMWQDGDIFTVLTVADSITQSKEDMIALAESLISYQDSHSQE